MEACLCDGGASCRNALEVGLSAIRSVVVAAVRSNCATKDRALLSGGDNCRANLSEIECSVAEPISVKTCRKEKECKCL